MGEIVEKELACSREGLKIYLKEYILEDVGAKAEKLPAVIVSHGFGDTLNGVECYCRMLAKMGYVAYGYDFCGGSRMGTGRSDGDNLSMTIQTECADLIAVIESIKKLSYVDVDNITLMGCSQGGFISSLVAAELGIAIKNLILVYPALCIPDHARMGRLGGAVYDAAHVPEVIECPNGMKLSKNFHEEVVGMDPFLEITKYKGRVLLMHGMKDSVVNYSYAVKAKESYEKEQCTLLLLKDAGHGFSEEQDESVRVAISQFLCGKNELFSIQIFITGEEIIEDTEEYKETAVRFTGYCDGGLFRGCIVPQGVDVQKQCGNAPKLLRAEYTLEGMDYTKNRCALHIVNEKEGEFYRPKITTDSKALGEICSRELVAALEGFDGGLTVRIFG